MSCDYTKLCYLEETKRLFREKIDPSGNKITDETPFRDYVGMITNLPAGETIFKGDGTADFVAGITTIEEENV